MKIKVTTFTCILAFLFLTPYESFSQSLNFNKSSDIWFPWESADYNAAFKRAFLDMEAFISQTGATEIGSGWTIQDDEVVLVTTVVVSAAAQSDMWEMAAWYENLSITCSSCSADYKRGLSDGASAFTSMPLTWKF